MFDITGEEISHLSDEDLRELIGRLCEAELRQNCLSTLAVTWGGNQNAPDGGIDVRVATTAGVPPTSAFISSNVGYQVKAEDMPRSRILSEMRPDGSLRAAIRKLADLSGAYIIVSSKASVSDSALDDRKNAMRDAIADLPNASDLKIDFYDGTRIATWVREHPGMVAWTRERLGRVLSGWRPYGDWAGSNEGVEAAYLFDDELRIQGPDLIGQTVSAIEGINLLRNILRCEHGVVRLVGLSGTGKTRLAQALFDHRIGENSLNPESAIYTDVSANPEPQPVALATDLVAQSRRQVLVIDNCTPDLHRRLSEICQSEQSKVNLLTIEYDVQDDQPEGTDVFELQPSSSELIEKLLLRRVPEISQVNANSIATFAGGNARVALALASTVERGESVASLRNAELFERLFRQRQQSNSSLLVSAQACSLPFSFQGEDTSDKTDSELPKLASVVGKDVGSLFADVAELKRRDLIQERGVWRAVLPHAIANRLAALALENIPPENLRVLFATAPPRLLRSISRRLGYLHTSIAAQRIVREWLFDHGRLGRVEELSELGIAMLTNVAPVDPVGVLDTIERAVQRQRELGAQLKGEQFRTLLVSLAFESKFFDRAVNLILDLIEFEEPGRYANQVRNSFPSLFHLYLSGTHATVEQRIHVIDGLLLSNSPTRQELGFASLDAMLKSSHFTSFHRFDFGGRPRDYGYFPRTREDLLNWFRAALNLCATHDGRDTVTSSKIRTIVSQNLQGLWDIEMFDEIEAVCREFRERRFWPEGWIAIRRIRRFRHDPLPEDEQVRILAIEHAIAPESLLEHVRAQVLRRGRAAYEDIDWRDHEAQFARQELNLIELGKIVATEAATLDEVMPELLSCSATTTLGPFAKGLVDGDDDRRGMWDRLIQGFMRVDPTIRSTELLESYLFNLQKVDRDLVETFLQDAMQRPELSEWFPRLQARVVISRLGVLRLKQSLLDGRAHVDSFRSLAYYGDLEDAAILQLVPLLLNLDGGFWVAVDIVSLRLPQIRNKKETPSPELLATGRLIADAFDFNTRGHHDEYELQQVFEACLSSREGIPVVERMLERLKAKHARFGLSLILEDHMLGALVAAQPLLVLNTFFASDAAMKRAVRPLIGHYDHVGSPFDRVPPRVLLPWCDEDPVYRYPLAASIIKAFDTSRPANKPQWNDIALALLERCPDKTEVLERFIRQLEPMGWVGSRGAAWQANLQLLDEFQDHPDAAFAAFARGERERLRKFVDDLRREELESERRQNETFE
ncbi:hypothetical protein [Occallatibacter riparius]|uniref:Uncharacterized protein n=1 Tax=Occallatibacter riparius TaxID=1002689 RepID=A0A9J7BQ10_9BACT|nr:hypothetical protein [Occallatibacter riparius]UWZ83197.1 hypothetical protein MOP44_21830 [Occallatibacter riparius]